MDSNNKQNKQETRAIRRAKPQTILFLNVIKFVTVNQFLYYNHELNNIINNTLKNSTFTINTTNIKLLV